MNLEGPIQYITHYLVALTFTQKETTWLQPVESGRIVCPSINTLSIPRLILYWLIRYEYDPHDDPRSHTIRMIKPSVAWIPETDGAEPLPIPLNGAHIRLSHERKASTRQYVFITAISLPQPI